MITYENGNHAIEDRLRGLINFRDHGLVMIMTESQILIDRPKTLESLLKQTRLLMVISSCIRYIAG
jgi:hypothetical protein